MKTLMASKDQLSFENWLKKYCPTYNYDFDREKRGDKRANRKYAFLWKQYESYLDGGAK